MKPKRSKTSLSAEAQRCVAIIESCKEAILSKSMDGVITGWNPAAERLYGYTSREMIGQKIKRLLPIDRQGEEKELLRRIQRGERISQFETVRVRKDGRLVHVVLTISPIKEASGVISGASIVARELAAGRNDDQALLTHAYAQLDRQTQALNRFALVAETDAQGRITYVNDQFCQVSRYTREELLGKTHRVVNSGIHPPEFWKQFWSTIRAGKTWRGEICNRAKDGSLYWVASTVVPFLDARGKPVKYLALRVLITELKETEKALAVARDNAIAANLAKSQFLANMSHEIRTPMNTVIGMAQLLERTRLSDRKRDYVATVLSSARSLLGIINDILDFSKIEANQMAVEQIPFSLRACVEEAVNLISRSAQSKGLALAASVQTEVPDAVLGDPTRLRQVLLNLLSNAVKFTAKGDVLLSVSHATVDGTKAAFHFSVKDSGIGMSPETLGALFTPFHQADAASTRRYGGTGLGLAISKALVARMGGSISVRSELGVGSTFSMTVPLPLCTSDRPPARATGLLRRRILLVDDHDTIRNALERQLTHLGLIVTTACNGPEACEKVRESIRVRAPFDVILMDRKMPGCDGTEAARILQSYPETAHIPVILTSGTDDFPDAKELKAMGIKGCLAKPFNFAQVSEALSRVLSGYCPMLPKAKYPRKSQQLRGARVLLSEDNPANQKLMQILLADLGMSVDTVGTGREAIRALQTSTYDIVLMDCQMPEMDGYQAAQEIRRNESALKRTPIIALTANALHGDREKCLAAGMDDYLAKPVDPLLMDRMLKKWVTVKPARQRSPALPARKRVAKALPCDLSILRRITGTDTRKMKELLQSYLRSTAREMERIRSAVETKDQPNAYRLAHGCAGASESFGMGPLGKTFRSLEADLKAGNFDEVPAQLVVLERDFEMLRRFLRARGH